MGVMTHISAENLPLSNDLQEYLTVQRWLRDKADKTKTNYLANMITFTKRSGMSPDQFLDWTKKVEPVEVQDQIDKMAEGLHDSTRFNFKIDMRSFLRHNGYNNLPRAQLSYTLKDWHRGYKRQEVKALLGYLDNLPHKLYVVLAVETGLRANTILDLQYHHISEDYEHDVIPCAVRLEPKFYGKRKSAGYTFIGERGVSLLREAIKAGLVKTSPNSPLVPLGYYGAYDALSRAREKANLDPKIQTNHGLRKYFEDALDKAGIDHEKKMMMEGHFAGTRAKHYTDRDWDELRSLYREAYPHIDVEAASPELQKQIQTQKDEMSDMKREMGELREQLTRQNEIIAQLLKKKARP